MPRGIEKTDWNEVHQLACDIANAAMQEDDVLAESKTEALLELLRMLLEKYPEHPSLIATIGDYLEDNLDRRAHYMKALAIARRWQYLEEIREIEDSLAELDDMSGE
jgi:hypothetical protein